MVVGHRHEIFRAGLFVEGEQIIGIKIFRLPLVDHVLETEL